MELPKAVLVPVAALALGSALMALAGCDSAALVRPPVDDFYRVEGVMVKEPNRNVSSAVVRVLHNDSTAVGVEVIVGNDTLLFDTLTYGDSVYALALGPADSLLVGNTPIAIHDGDRFNDTLYSLVPGVSAIASIVPTLKGPADLVRVEWTGAANTRGYVLAAVKQDSVYQGVGWSQFVTGSVTSGTINDSAFTRTTLQGAEPDPGIYYVYVYSYTGAPDSALSARWLPVPFPAQLDDNIDDLEVGGRLGTVVVSYYGSVEVLAAP